MSSADANRLRAFATLTKYVESREWTVEKIRPTAFQAKVEGDLCPVDLFFQVHDQFEQFLFYVVPRINLLPDMMPNVAEYICRVNTGLRIGNFATDYENGQVSVKSSVNFEAVELTEQLIDNTVRPALDAYEEFFPSLLDVMAGAETPESAVRKLDGQE